MKPGIPKGTRDFSAVTLAKRNFIFDTIRKSFELFGFQEIETPSFENSSTLMGKYGDEGDRLIFKILNSGDYLKKVDEQVLLNKNSSKITSEISEKALRYDLTVPFARYVVQHQNEITFPFKRYQIQPVWRADRPQKGRFREFYQCDADVVGSKSLIQEVEFIQLYDNVFTDLDIKGTVIKINNRKILAGIAEVIGAKDQLINFTVALDKLDKIGREGVEKEMFLKGISEESIEKASPLFSFKGSNEQKVLALSDLLKSSDEGMKGVNELSEVLELVSSVGLKTAKLDIDITLARGLNYYTGAIFEVSAPEQVKIGSIGGGGRYDDLTGVFGLKDVSGVGVSFGLDRIYLVMEELNLFKSVELAKPKVLFLNFNSSEIPLKLKAIELLRANGIKSEIYPDLASSNNQQKKQWKYADKRAIQFVITDVSENTFVVKNQETNERIEVGFEEILNFVS